MLLSYNMFYGYKYKGYKMTIGIYCLRFKGTDKVYIGQSDNIEGRRYQEHLLSFKKKTAAHKLLQAYLMYGEPILDILCECTLEDLNSTENEAIEIFNAVDNGFNSLEKAGMMPIHYGELSSNSTHTNEQIIKAFNLLIDFPDMPFKDVSKSTEVSLGVLWTISKSTNHLWLEEQFPERYARLRALKGCRSKNSAKTKGIIYPPIISPEGNIFIVENVNKFAKENNLNIGHLGSVLRGSRPTHKGWKLLK